MLMDSQEAEVEAEVEVEVGRTKRRGVASAVLRCTLGLVFLFILIFFALWFISFSVPVERSLECESGKPEFRCLPHVLPGTVALGKSFILTETSSLTF